MSRRTVVVLPERRRREAGLGWCWSANCEGYTFELVVPDDLLDRLGLQGASPSSVDRDEASLFFEKIEAGARKRLAKDASKPSFIILSSDDLAEPL